jgi:acetyl-CoA acetyltransferase family protein
MVYIVDAVRTAIGRYGGALAGTRPDDLLAHVIRALVARNPGLDLNDIEDVIAGDANQAGEDTRNVARMAALIAGLPVSVPGNTVNRLCASGLQAIMDASRAILCGEGMVYIAGGVESMSRAPFVLPRGSVASGTNEGMEDSTIGWRFANPRLTDRYPPLTMGETAEHVAKQYHIGRERQDGYAKRSHEKYFAAKKDNRFAREITAISVTDHKGRPTLFDSDEYPRETSMKTLSALKPAFAADGTVTAGNSSGLNDGAAAVLLMNEEGLQKYGMKPLARVLSMAVSGIDPAFMGMGPVDATRKALKRAGLTIGILILPSSMNPLLRSRLPVWMSLA